MIQRNNYSYLYLSSPVYAYLFYTGAGGAAYTYYNDKKKYPNTITETWKYGR